MLGSTLPEFGVATTRKRQAGPVRLSDMRKIADSVTAAKPQRAKVRLSELRGNLKKK
jgi:hypothetical protein